MKKILLAIGVGLVAFTVGLVGTYVALPRVAPDVTQSAAPADSAAVQTTAPAESDTPRPLPNGTAPDSTTATQPIQPSVSMEAVNQLRDSLAVMHDSIRTLATTEDQLNTELAELQDQVQSLQATRTKAADIAKTLTQLEDDELQAVLKELDMRIYKMLYTESSGRARTRLLQSLPPERAARLVDRMVSEN